MSVSASPVDHHRNSSFERRLVSRFQTGEPEAVNTLFEMHVDSVYAYARHILGSPEDAEEVTSEAFLRAFQRAATFRGECPFRGWLFGITRNLCMDRLRQPRLLFLDTEQADAEPDRGQGADRLDTTVVVRGAMTELPEEQRLALMLCDVQQWDAREAAEVLGKSLPATKSLLYRARRSLRDRLADTWRAG